jgi:hypothetical protein
MSVVFRARDASQREHLLYAIDSVLDMPNAAEYVAGQCVEGDGCSSYLFTFFRSGVRAGQASQRVRASRSISPNRQKRRDQARRARRAQKR